MRKKMLLLTLVLAALAAPAPVAADTDGGPPFPVGACVKVALVNDKPTCVIIDPTK